MFLRHRALSFAVLCLVGSIGAGGCGGDVPTNYLDRSGGKGSTDSGSGGSSSHQGGEAGALGEDDGGASSNPQGGSAGASVGSGANGGTGVTAGAGGSGGTTSGGSAGSAGSAGTGGTSGVQCGNDEIEEGEDCEPPMVNGSWATGQVENCNKNCQELTSDECLQCEEDSEDLGSELFYYVAGDGACATYPEDSIAATGPAAGYKRSDLCWIMLECVRRTECAEFGVTNCYCGSSADCSAPNGDCKAEVEQSLEGVGLAVISVRMSDATYGGGMALEQARLDSEICKSQCFDDPSVPVQKPASSTP